MSYESPAEHPTITDEERCYIEESIGESVKLSGPAEVRPSRQAVSFSPPDTRSFQSATSMTFCLFARETQPNLFISQIKSFVMIHSRNSRHPGGSSSPLCLSMQSLWQTSAGAGPFTCCSLASLHTSRRCLASR